jgi:hypothetical protein
MTEAEWLACADPDKPLQYFRDRFLSRPLRLFACACVHRIWQLLADKQFREAIEVAERYADGDTTKKQLEALHNRCHKLASTPLRNTRTDPMTSTAEIAATDCLRADPVEAAMYGAWYAALAEARTDSANGRAWKVVRAEQATLIREIFENPYRWPLTLDPEWLTSTVVALARQMYKSRDFSAMPILADALQDAGCDNADILDHCRGPGAHVRGCWVVDLVLAKT